MPASDTDTIRTQVMAASDDELLELAGTIRAALEGDSNDAEHDALVDVAQFFDLEYGEPADA